MTKRKNRKLLMVIIIIFILIISGFITTKLVYDGIFSRYSDTYSIADIGYERIDLYFESDGNRLRGYLFPGDKKGLVVVAPGFNAEADDYLMQTEAFLEKGYGVFLFDVTGSGNSGGDSVVGFPQEIIDLDAGLDYIEEKNNFGYDNIFLFGHSRGGYAICSQLPDHDIAGAVSVSGINSCMEAIMQGATDAVGNVAYCNYPMLWLYQSMLFGSDTVNISACDYIDEADVPVLIVQGDNDLTAPKDEYSIYSHRDEIDSKLVEYYICDTPGKDGHTDLLFDNDGSANRELMNRIINFYDRIAGA